MKKYVAIPVIKLTSSKLTNSIFQSEIGKNTDLNKKQKELITKLFKEATENNFEVIIEKAE